MQAENWKTIKELLHEVLLIEPLQRREFLKAARGDSEILAEVESLLAFEADSADFMSLSLGDFSKDFVVEKEISMVGQRIGIYEIVGELGCGGMGAVYLAERRDGKFEQQVAIKMLKREYNVAEIRRNFKREKEIQSKLNHPNIARLLDAGSCADGVPYLVMEYIEGVPIDKFCENKNLPLNARLKLFNRVCEAVAFAHRNLIVHRDLKPSNILVTPNGEPKLLDFGISKLLDAGNSETGTALTMRGAMTPEYASPEQIKGEAVTTATDVYSLGVVLYKILTGAYPYNLSDKSNGELLRIITEDEPTAPSAISNFKSEISIKDNRKSQIANRKFLKGDIDNIILKSLAKEPARRYQTVEQFSADLWRYIDGLPVLARPVTFAYQARKFYGRNKISVFAGLFIFLSLLIGLTVALWQADVARGQARIASDARQSAELEAANAVNEQKKAQAEKEKAEQISRFMMKVLAYANPRWYAEGAKYQGETKVIEAMTELSDKIDVEFANRPDIQAELHHKFAEVYQSNVNRERAEQAKSKALYHARRALALRREFYGERHELVAKDLAYLFWTGGVERENWAEHLTEAIQMMRETNPHNLNLPYMLETYTGLLLMPEAAEYHEEFLEAVRPATAENKYQIAERYLLESLPIFREHYSEDNTAIYANECKLAYARIMQNKFAEAAPHLEICRAAVTKFQNDSQLPAVRKYLSIAEEAATAANR